MRCSVDLEQRDDLQLVLDGDVFEKETDRNEFELQYPMPSPGTGEQTTQTQSTTL